MLHVWFEDRMPGKGQVNGVRARAHMSFMAPLAAVLPPSPSLPHKGGGGRDGDVMDRSQAGDCGSGEPAVAMLVLFAGAAGAEFVATDFAPG